MQQVTEETDSTTIGGEKVKLTRRDGNPPDFRWSTDDAKGEIGSLDDGGWTFEPEFDSREGREFGKKVLERLKERWPEDFGGPA